MDVKQLRRKLGLTQQELADKLGVKVRTVQNWEMGRKIPPQTEALLQMIDEKGLPAYNVNVAGVNNSEVALNTADPAQFIDTLNRQQDIINRHLDEIAETRKLVQKKDEQIDKLLQIISQNKA